MASSWLSTEVLRAVAQARVLEARVPGAQLFLYYRRGELRVAPRCEEEGWRRATRLNVPLDRTDGAIAEWMTWELRSEPCHPERG